MSNLKLTDISPENIIFFPAAVNDFLAFYKSRQIKIIKALQKISKAPSSFGKELENQAGRPLSGYRSIYADNKSIRIIWKVAQGNIVEVAIIAGIAEQDAMIAYKLASIRKGQFEEFVDQLFKNNLTQLSQKQSDNFSLRKVGRQDIK